LTLQKLQSIQLSSWMARFLLLGAEFLREAVMLISSASQNQYAYKARPSIATEAAQAVQQTKAGQSKAAGDGASPPASTGALFSNGKFTGAAQLTSPETLASLFQLNSDGTVAHTDGGAPVVKKAIQGVGPDWIARMLAQGSPDTWSVADKQAASELAKITDDDKAMFRQVTGYNLFTAGPISTIVDDNGNPPTGDDAKAAGELFNRLQYARNSGQEVDADWFHGVSKDIADWGGPKFPADWDQKADAWFDDVTKARREAKAAEEGASASSAVAAQSAASKPVERSQMQAATQAYDAAAKLAAPVAG
jgi:hypothetical protein